MNKKELLEQLKSLEENQRDFISNDDTGVFERDCRALELAYSIINEIDLKELESFRICSDCGNIMNAGYCIHDGNEIFYLVKQYGKFDTCYNQNEINEFLKNKYYVEI